jgi:predicted phage-related endonuclease
VERNEDFVEEMLSKEREFWQCVLDGTPPGADGSPSSKKILEAMYNEPIAESELEIEPSQFYPLFLRREEISKQVKLLEEEKDLIDNKFREALGNNEIGLCEDKFVSLKQVKGGTTRRIRFGERNSQEGE